MLPARVRRPAFDRAAVRAGIVHLGVGAFHRAHQAVVLDDVLARGETLWGILGASLRSPATRDALLPQDWLYTLRVRSGADESLRVVGSLLGCLVAPEDPERLVAAMADPSIRIVTLTVTEKGYCRDPATGELDADHPDIHHDLARPERPRSVPGFLLAALRRRHAAGIPPFTVLSCDNLPANGRAVRQVLADLAMLMAPELARWVRDEIACPSSVVDRIVPATTGEDRASVAAALGVEDAWPVVAEPFLQWVVEDRFPAGRPDLAAVGADLVADVAPYERMKLRIGNGAHSVLAYLGLLVGHATIAEAMADPDLAAFVTAMLAEEVTPTLAVPAGTDIARYRATFLKRFADPALRHRTAQVAMDGTQKLPQRLLAPIRELLAANAPFGRLALGVAAWMRCVLGTDEAGRPLPLEDPLAPRLRALAAEAGPVAARLVPALLGVRELFGEDLPRDPRFRAAVEGALDRLLARGVRHTLAGWPRR